METKYIQLRPIHFNGMRTPLVEIEADYVREETKKLHFRRVTRITCRVKKIRLAYSLEFIQKNRGSEEMYYLRELISEINIQKTPIGVAAGLSLNPSKVKIMDDPCSAEMHEFPQQLWG